MEEIILNVEGMHCGGCENRIKNALSVIDGVKEVEANHEMGIVKIKTENSNIDEIKETIEDLGFEVK